MLQKNNHIWVARIITSLRLIVLSLLFGGSSAIVYAAITLVKAAESHGIPAAQAATANAPIFIQVSHVLLGAGILLLALEAIDFAQNKKPQTPEIFRYTASLLCVATTIIFALAIVPPLAEILPILKSASNLPPAELTRIHVDFHRLHEISRVVFGGIIFTALIALVTQAFTLIKAES